MTESSFSFFFGHKNSCEVSFKPYLILEGNVTENYKCHDIDFIVL